MQILKIYFQKHMRAIKYLKNISNVAHHLLKNKKKGN